MKYSDNMDYLVAEDISKQFVNHKALNNVSIHVPKQSIFGLLGPNGAGKTTLIRIINQITAADTGKVYLKGQHLRPGHVNNIGYLPEERGLYRKMKVGEQALYLAQLKDVPAKEAKERLMAWFKKFDIDSWWDKKVEELSKGMQQKIQFITTVLHEPELLIFDEPFSGFDPINANILKEEILRLRDEGATVIFSTHNMSSVEELCDNIALIHNAHKILDGEMTTIKKEYRNNTFTTRLSNLKGSFRTELHPDFKILESEVKEDFIEAKVKIINHATPNELIRNLIQIGEIQSFNEVIPSMNDIFIRKVQENK